MSWGSVLVVMVETEMEQTFVVTFLSLSCVIRILCPWDFPGKNTRVGYNFLLQGIFPAASLHH